SEYASEAFGVGAKGYLMKPIQVDEVLQLENDLRKIKTNLLIPKLRIPIYMKVKSLDGKTAYDVKVNDILFMYSLGNYVKVYTKGMVSIVYGSLTRIEELLCPSDHFFKIS